jgi:hypothetical protein
MSNEGNTNTEDGKDVKELDVTEEELKRDLEGAIKEELRKHKNSYHYTIVVQEEIDEEGFLINHKHRVFLNSEFDIPRKQKEDAGVIGKEAFDHFYRLGFDSFQSSKLVGREAGNSYQVFTVGSEQVEQSISSMGGYWVTVDSVSHLTELHNSELESILYDIPQLVG